MEEGWLNDDAQARGRAELASGIGLRSLVYLFYDLSLERVLRNTLAQE